MTKEKLAYIISSIFRPEFIGVAMVFFVLTHTGLSQVQIYRLGFLYLGTEFVAPLMFLKIYLHAHQGVTWELTRRQNRYAYLSFVACCSVIALALTMRLGNHFLFSLALVGFIILVINIVITFFWKISLHMAGITIPVLAINYLGHWHALYLFLLIPVVAWARYVLKRHTLAQILAGIFVNIALGLLLVPLLQR